MLYGRGGMVVPAESCRRAECRCGVVCLLGDDGYVVLVVVVGCIGCNTFERI
jgi:hypothetical protein